MTFKIKPDKLFLLLIVPKIQKRTFTSMRIIILAAYGEK